MATIDWTDTQGRPLYTGRQVVEFIQLAVESRSVPRRRLRESVDDAGASSCDQDPSKTAATARELAKRVGHVLDAVRKGEGITSSDVQTFKEVQTLLSDIAGQDEDPLSTPEGFSAFIKGRRPGTRALVESGRGGMSALDFAKLIKRGNS